ncbi:MAG TPA: hypothetical protein PKC69_11260, partial [Chitinophagaceae bacterium]|nr:hypothetical protein [Chitinophagaceae bacterium]
FRFKIYEWRAGVERWPLIIVCFPLSAFCHADEGGIQETGYVKHWQQVFGCTLRGHFALLSVTKRATLGSLTIHDSRRRLIFPVHFWYKLKAINSQLIAFCAYLLLAI